MEMMTTMGTTKATRPTGGAVIADALEGSAEAAQGMVVELAMMMGMTMSDSARAGAGMPGSMVEGCAEDAGVDGAEGCVAVGMLGGQSLSGSELRMCHSCRPRRCTRVHRRVHQLRRIVWRLRTTRGFAVLTVVGCEERVKMGRW
jgi:hypothetical protein